MANLWDEPRLDFFSLGDPWSRDIEREIHSAVLAKPRGDAGADEIWLADTGEKSSGHRDYLMGVHIGVAPGMYVLERKPGWWIDSSHLRRTFLAVCAVLKSEAVPWIMLFVGASAFSWRAFETGEWLFTALTTAALSLYLAVISIAGKK